jgi:hypothetical protein
MTSSTHRAIKLLLGAAVILELLATGCFWGPEFRGDRGERRDRGPALIIEGGHEHDRGHDRDDGDRH